MTSNWLFTHRIKLIGGVVIAIVVATTYAAGLQIGFWLDDYAFLETAARLSFPDYLAWYFDPRAQALWYRPIPGMFWWWAWHTFHGDALGYHVVYLVIHIANSLLLFAIVARVFNRWLAGFCSALLYAGLGIYHQAVLRPSDETALAALFYLLALFLWLLYLDSRQRRYQIATGIFFVLALFSKEASVTLPVMLFLSDRWVVREPVSLTQLIRRYAFFAIVIVPYLLFELRLAPNTVYRNALGYGLGSHILPVFFEYLTRLAFPWTLPAPFNYVWLMGLLSVLGFLIMRRSDSCWLFLTAGMVITCVPYVLFQYIFNRFLYVPMLFAGAILGALLTFGGLALMRRPWQSILIVLGWTGLVAFNGWSLMKDIDGLSRLAREWRLPVRAVVQLHPTLPADTLLHFINPPVPLYGGMFLLHYGSQVAVNGDISTYDMIWRNVPPKFANLREHAAAYVIYFDEQGNMREQKIDGADTTTSTPAVPVDFGALQLEHYEIASATIQRGQALVILLYWQAKQSMERDYTLFAHLVDASGTIVAGLDSQPRSGTMPTHQWTPRQRIADWIILPIDDDVPLSRDYRLEIGWYNLATMERLSIHNSAELAQDSLTIAPFIVSK